MANDKEVTLNKPLPTLDDICREEVLMRQLSDYSGEFITNLRPVDFCHETLAELLVLYSRLFMAMDGFWYLAVRERLGDEAVLACDIQAWENYCRYATNTIRRKLRIRGRDVVSAMKVIQVCPGFQIIDYEIDIKGKNYAILTVTRCPTLEALEAQGRGGEEQICNIVERSILTAHVSCFNPDIQVKSLKLPPRKSKDDISCQWEFSLGSQ